MNLTLQKLLQKIYPFYENIGTEYLNQQNFMVRFFGKSVIETDEWEFLNKTSFLNDVFSGAKKLPIKQARYLISHRSDATLLNFLNARPNTTLQKLSDEFEDYFGVIKKESIAKKICDTFYELVTNIRDKGARSERVSATYLDNSITTNECLAKIVNALSTVTEEKLNEYAKLKLDPQPVEDKIPDNFPLRNEVINNVYSYYHYINQLLVEASKTNSVLGRKLNETVKNVSDNYIKSALTQEQVMTNMASWLKSITQLVNIDDMYFRFMVAYFVQHCEVFSYETTE